MTAVCESAAAAADGGGCGGDSMTQLLSIGDNSVAAAAAALDDLPRAAVVAVDIEAAAAAADLHYDNAVDNASLRPSTQTASHSACPPRCAFSSCTRPDRRHRTAPE